ncbi:hypothetical protein E2C01_060658 [Portunus trituberculatus]|uniref:Uncharacterized protein n=1 Tax=Portunus trituberculatus TaxID=210409 RepID=A0A5B7H350_PORTR|nr:hypothetical protein [Portunus trituberculatus]
MYTNHSQHDTHYPTPTFRPRNTATHHSTPQHFIIQRSGVPRLTQLHTRNSPALNPPGRVFKPLLCIQKRDRYD